MDAGQKNYIGLLNERAQKNGWSVQFDLEQTTGPDHIKTFIMTAVLNGKKYPEGSGRNKKEAKQNAAKNAYVILENDETPNTYICGDKEFPEANANNKKEAKEAAAKLVYESLKELEKESVPEENRNGEENRNIQNRRTSLQNLELSTPTDTDSTPTGKNNYIGLLNEYCQRNKQVNHFEGVDRKGSAHSPDESPDNASSSQKCYSAQSKSESILFTNAQSNVNKLKTPEALEKRPTDSSLTKSRFLTEFDPDSITKIGKGGQGRVYKAKRKLENIIFAVKIVKFTEKSCREVKALSRFAHANIVRYHTSWTEETEYRDETTDTESSSNSNSGSHFLYIQMEFCEGKTLREWIDERNNHPQKYPERRQEAATIIKQVLEAVKYIHSKSHIHRDLKPANIMFGHEGGVKVGDFGLVTTYEEEDEGNLLERSRQVGTSTYMSPEQKQKNYDKKVDIYPLGLIYFELLWQFGTKSERSSHWKSIREQDFPEKFSIMFDFEVVPAAVLAIGLALTAPIPDVASVMDDGDTRVLQVDHLPGNVITGDQEDKMELLNIAKKNAAKILGIDAVKLPSSVKCIEDQVKKPLEGDKERRVSANPLKKTTQDKGEMDEVELSKTSPVRKPINFSINNVVAKPSGSPTFSVPDSKVTSRADSVGNRLPYGQWIPVKTVSPKKR
ncbi:Interferon-induced, double-stranded RNA-activated protein kinase [Bagarius yarrelli]|uniref:Interferon-induced, double-stranded RNA-activated protein kinase n=1 Tax=Bagarius yarrelli TaxID=175774 RepID=A0A556V437_BAGYA|nr:Interferon-induced, double-stranded RNA-activated protein kinase [Bagarius yarrelli]